MQTRVWLWLFWVRLNAKRYRSVLEGKDRNRENWIEDGIAVEMWGRSTGRQRARNRCTSHKHEIVGNVLSNFLLLY
jgi:hypothetical protein